MLIAFDDNWQDDPAQAAQITAAGFAPQNTLEPAIAVTLSPGPYTAIIAGKNGTTGVGLVEITILIAWAASTKGHSAFPPIGPRLGSDPETLRESDRTTREN